MILKREEILQQMPFGEEWLLLDEVEVDIGNRTARGKSYLTGNELFFRGHFPDLPIMPGVMVIEAIAQTGACLTPLLPEFENRLPMLSVVEHFSFLKPVEPPASLTTCFAIEELSRNKGRARAQATVDRFRSPEGRYTSGEVLVAEGRISFALVPRRLFELMHKQAARKPAAVAG